MFTKFLQRNLSFTTSKILSQNTNRFTYNLLNKFSSAENAVPPTATLKSVHTKSLKSLGLDFISPTDDTICYYNLPYGEVQDHAVRNHEGLLVSNGAFSVDTGKFTGRSPSDKFVVKQEPSSGNIWWGDQSPNQPMDPKVFDTLYERAVKHYKNSVDTVYVLDGYCGAHESSRKNVRFITEKAWQSHFVKNMFIRVDHEDLPTFTPDFTILNCYNLTAQDYKKLGLNSEVFVAFNIEKKLAIIGGTFYGGEMKKGIFSMMHYWLPTNNILSMHCSANIGIKKNDVCLFFGLSGTGKTTLSTDSNRKLIGDDEHGWDDNGIFNFEGGCYAKTSKLSAKNEPEIYNAIKFNSVLENVWVDPNTRKCDYFNLSITENGRVSYPIEHIENREDTLAGGHPKYIIFLCCDAFGVLPPIARLTSGEAMYHFISGYTAKVAGTERGIIEPQATFSPCYGAAFLTLPPTKYAQLLKENLEKYNVKCYLVNTGWSGGPYGVGNRVEINFTRNCINSIFNGSINESRFRKDKLFNFEVPENIPNVDNKLLNPRNTWKDKNEYDKQQLKLANSFAKNITKYTDDVNLFKDCGPIAQIKEL